MLNYESWILSPKSWEKGKNVCSLFNLILKVFSQWYNAGEEKDTGSKERSNSLSLFFSQYDHLSGKYEIYKEGPEMNKQV